MVKIYYGVLSLFLLYSGTRLSGAAEAAGDPLSDLPEVAQDADVHSLQKHIVRLFGLGFGRVDI